eukprot:959388_1
MAVICSRLEISDNSEVLSDFIDANFPSFLIRTLKCVSSHFSEVSGKDAKHLDEAALYLQSDVIISLRVLTEFQSTLRNLTHCLVLKDTFELAFSPCHTVAAAEFRLSMVRILESVINTIDDDMLIDFNLQMVNSVIMQAFVPWEHLLSGDEAKDFASKQASIFERALYLLYKIWKRVGEWSDQVLAGLVTVFEEDGGYMKIFAAVDWFIRNDVPDSIYERIVGSLAEMAYLGKCEPLMFERSGSLFSIGDKRQSASSASDDASRPSRISSLFRSNVFQVREPQSALNLNKSGQLSNTAGSPRESSAPVFNTAAQMSSTARLSQSSTASWSSQGSLARLGSMSSVNTARSRRMSMPVRSRRVICNLEVLDLLIQLTTDFQQAALQRAALKTIRKFLENNELNAGIMRKRGEPYGLLSHLDNFDSEARVHCMRVLLAYSARLAEPLLLLNPLRAALGGCVQVGGRQRINDDGLEDRLASDVAADVLRTLAVLITRFPMFEPVFYEADIGSVLRKVFETVFSRIVQSGSSPAHDEALVAVLGPALDVFFPLAMSSASDFIRVSDVLDMIVQCTADDRFCRPALKFLAQCLVRYERPNTFGVSRQSERILEKVMQSFDLTRGNFESHFAVEQCFRCLCSVLEQPDRVASKISTYLVASFDFGHLTSYIDEDGGSLTDAQRLSYCQEMCFFITSALASCSTSDKTWNSRIGGSELIQWLVCSFPEHPEHVLTWLMLISLGQIPERAKSVTVKSFREHGSYDDVHSTRSDSEHGEQYGGLCSPDNVAENPVIMLPKITGLLSLADCFCDMFLILSRAGLPFQRRALATTALILEDGRNGMKLASHGCIGSLIAYYRDIHDPTNTATEGSAQVLIPDILEAISLIASFACSMEDLHKILALLRDEFNCKVREKSVEKFVITARKSSTKTVLSDRSISYGTIGPNGWEKAADLDSLSSIASGDTSILSTVSYGTTPSFLNDNPGSILASTAVSSHHGTLHGSHNGIQHGPQHGTHNGIKHGNGRPNCARSILDCLTVVTRNSGDPSVVFDMRSSGTAFMGIPMPDMGEVKGYSLGVWVMFEEIDDRSSPIQLFYWEDSADRPILDISICLNGKDFVLSIKIADHHSIQTSLSIALHQWHFILFHHVYHVLKSSELLVYCDGARVCAHNVQYPQLARASAFAYCGWRPLVNRVGEVGRKASAVRSMWKLASIMMIEGSIRDQSVKSLFECDRDFMVLDDLAVQCDVFAMLSQSPDSRNLHPSLRQSMVFFYHARNLDFSPEDNLELKLNASQDPRCKIAPANSQRLPHFTNANVPATLHGDCFVLTPKSFSSAVRQCGGLQLFFEFIDKCKTSEQLSQLTTLLHGLLRNDFKNVCIMNSPCGLFDATGFQMFHFLLSQKRSLLNKECVGALLGYMGIPNAPRTLPERALQVIALINLGESALFHCSPETSSMFYQELVNMMVVSPMKWQTIKIFQDISMVRIILDVLQSKDFFDISLGGPVSVIREMLSLGDDRPQFVQDIHWDLQLVVDCVMSWNIKRTYVQKSDPTLSAHLDKCCAALLEMLVDVAMQTKTLRRLQILQYYMKRAYIFALFEGSSPESSSNGGAESGHDSLKMSRSTFHALHLLWVFLYLDSEYFIQFRQNAGFSALCHVLTKFHGDPQLYVMLFLMMEKHPLELTSPDKYSFWSKRE